MKLGMKTLTDYVGREPARILEESGYRSREDIMSARVIDLLLIGSFSVFSLERLIVALYREEHPRSKMDVDELFEEPMEEVTVLGRKQSDDPTPKMKKMTVRELCQIPKLNAQKIIVLLRIIHNGTISKERQNTYYEMFREMPDTFRETAWAWEDYE